MQSNNTALKFDLVCTSFDSLIQFVCIFMISFDFYGLTLNKYYNSVETCLQIIWRLQDLGELFYVLIN